MTFAMKAYAVKLEMPRSALVLCCFVHTYMPAGRVPSIQRCYSRSLQVRAAFADTDVGDAQSHQEAHTNAMQALSIRTTEGSKSVVY